MPPVQSVLWWCVLLEALWHEMEAPGSKVASTVLAAAPQRTRSLPLELRFAGLRGACAGRGCGGAGGQGEPGRLPQVLMVLPQEHTFHCRLFSSGLVLCSEPGMGFGYSTSHALCWCVFRKAGSRAEED